MNSWIKNAIGIVASLIILILVLIIGSIYMLNSSLPEYSGTVIVEDSEQEIEIYRDKFGVPYIKTNSELDAYFALGYVHAQERLFQMDLSRRAGEGRLSEILGTKTIFFDKLFKTIGIGEIAEKNYLKYDKFTQNILLAYSNGVNEFINNSSEKLTIEFDILGYKPYTWKPEHSLIIAKLMAWELNISWWSDIAITHLIQKLGKEKAEDVLPNFDENGPTIIPEDIKKYSFVPMDLIRIDKDFREFFGLYGTHIGSNNWVVNGGRSLSGKPIIANDPHLGFAVPGKWYVACLNSPGLKVDGFTIPGVPGIVIGKNDKISWVLTNIMADDSDFYIEQLDSTKNNYYLNNEWHPLEIIKDTINVKDSTDIIFEIRKNHRGPIVSDIHNFNKLFPNEYQGKSDISMRWSALEFSNEILAFNKINKAANWSEFKEGVNHFHSPGQNFVYADFEGNIGYIAGVKLPKRKNNSPSFVYNGKTTEYDWDGYIPFKENPKLLNPAQGYIASANNKTIKEFPFHISNIWEPTSRITRIAELIESKEKHDINDFKRYQTDFYSHYAKKMVPFILSAFENYKINDDKINTAIKILKQWDFQMISESQVASIYAVYFQFLLKNILVDEMGEILFKEYVFLANIPLRVVSNLLEENESGWFDNKSTDNIETRDDIIRKSFIDAIEYLELAIGLEIKSWQWGKIHKVTFKHFFHGTSNILDNILDIGPYEIGGDGTTIFNGEYYFSSPYENKLGPSMRFIYDFSNPDVFEFILPTGQSGHFFSNHYDDMTQSWLNGDYVSVNTNIDSVENANYDLLKLIPTR